MGCSIYTWHNEAQLDPEKQEFLNKIIGEASQALEGIRLRKRELQALRELQSLARTNRPGWTTLEPVAKPQ